MKRLHIIQNIGWGLGREIIGREQREVFDLFFELISEEERFFAAEKGLIDGVVGGGSEREVMIGKEVITLL